MRFAVRTLAAMLVGVALLRAALFLVYAWTAFFSPYEVYYLEGSFVHLCRRAQNAITLYPDYAEFPHVANFYGPLYPAFVGWLGRLSDASVSELFNYGRLVTVIATLTSTAIVAAAIRHKSGSMVALTSAAFGLGSFPMFGNSVMARPDALAELLGVVGFFAATGQRRSARWFGLICCAAAILTKQTAACFPLAAVIVCCCLGQWRRGITLACLTVVLVAGPVAVLSLTLEPKFGASFVGQMYIPWQARQGGEILARIALYSPELVALSLVGSWHWCRTATRDLRLAPLAGALLAVSVVPSFKLGSDANYFLHLRLINTLAFPAVHAAINDGIASFARRAFLASVAVMICLPSMVVAVVQAWAARQEAAMLASDWGMQTLAAHRQLLDLASRQDVQILTDSPLLAAHQEERAAIVDPFLFRTLVETGRIHLGNLIGRIRNDEFDWVILKHDVASPAYDAALLSLPPPIAKEIRDRCQFVGIVGRLFVYHPTPRFPIDQRQIFERRPIQSPLRNVRRSPRRRQRGIDSSTAGKKGQPECVVQYSSLPQLVLWSFMPPLRTANRLATSASSSCATGSLDPCW